MYRGAGRGNKIASVVGGVLLILPPLSLIAVKYEHLPSLKKTNCGSLLFFLDQNHAASGAWWIGS
jgi:hypothetical protein